MRRTFGTGSVHICAAHRDLLWPCRPAQDASGISTTETLMQVVPRTRCGTQVLLLATFGLPRLISSAARAADRAAKSHQIPALPDDDHQCGMMLSVTHGGIEPLWPRFVHAVTPTTSCE